MNTSTDISPGYPPAINGWLDEEVGRTFTATVIGFDQAPSRYGGDVVIVTFEETDGDRHSLWLTRPSSFLSSLG